MSTELTAVIQKQAAEIDRLRAELAEAKFCTGCNGGEWTWQRRAEEAEAAIARVRELCDAHLNSSGRMSMPIDATEVLRALDGE